MADEPESSRDKTAKDIRKKGLVSDDEEYARHKRGVRAFFKYGIKSLSQEILQNEGKWNTPCSESKTISLMSRNLDELLQLLKSILRQQPSKIGEENINDKSI